jgi:cysteine desulfurase
MDCIYLDNNSTTPTLPAVVGSMRPFFDATFANPASAHQLGRLARRALEDAREQVASLLGAFADEVVFTSGATEANNLALRSLAGQPPGHLIASAVEHPSVSEPLRHLGEQGFSLSLLPVDGVGVVRVDTLAGILRPETRLVAVMLANHETGAIQPIQQVVDVAGAVPVHCDATQAVGKIAVRFHDLGVSTLALSDHKFHGPRGIGALVIRRCTQVAPVFHGGHQQRGIRPGTEPVALAVGLATALQLASDEREARLAHVLALRRRFLAHLHSHAAPVVLNGPVDETGIPHTINLSFPGLQADLLLMALDLAGVCCSTGSACSSGSLQPSPVLRAMDVPENRLKSALRFSLSALLCAEEIDEAARRICRVVERLRRGSPASELPELASR